MDSARQILTQARAVWQRQSTGRRMIAVLAVVGTLAALIWFGRGPGGPTYGVLFSGLTPADAGEVATELSARGVPFKLTQNGTAVEVPGDDVYRVRMELAAAGLPKGGGVGFEIFDAQKFGTSSFVEQVNYRRALQGELGRSIAALDAVDGARVHIAMGKRSVFRDSDEPPTASVALDLRGGRTLSRDQVQGIVHLVSSSVDGLAPDRVTVIDDAGNVLSREGAAGGGGGSQNDLEVALTKRVADLVEKVVGVGQAAVTVTAEMDQSKVDQTEEIFDKDSAALRSEARVIEGGSGVADGSIGGVAGARGNLPGAPAPTAAGTAPGGGGGASHLQETRNWEINRIVRRTVGPDVKIKRLQVAVLVNDAPPATEGGPRVARTKEQLDQIAALARTAAGLDDARGDKIEVRSVSWDPVVVPEGEPEPAALKPWEDPKMLGAAGAGLVLIIVVFLLVRKKKEPKLTALAGAGPALGRPTKVAELEAALQAGTLPAALSGALALKDPTAEMHERILGSVKEDAPRAARILSAWLADEDGKAAS